LERLLVKIARGGWSHILVVLLVPGALAAVFFYFGWLVAAAAMAVLAAVLVAFMVYFFRDPDRPALADGAVVVSGADGWVRCVEEVPEPRFLKTDCLRISTFLTPFRCPREPGSRRGYGAPSRLHPGQAPAHH
jgi:phosphatidylserine decarboxylase